MEGKGPSILNPLNCISQAVEGIELSPQEINDFIKMDLDWEEEGKSSNVIITEKGYNDLKGLIKNKKKI